MFSNIVNVPAIKRSISSMSHRPSDEAHSIMRSTGVAVVAVVVADPWKRGCKYSSRPTNKAVVVVILDEVVVDVTKDVTVVGKSKRILVVERMVVVRSMDLAASGWLSLCALM